MDAIWKAMGARWGYSSLNGLLICAIALFGAVGQVLNLVPLEVTLGILLWIGLVITAQAFQASPPHHALAVGVGLVPALASWLLVQIEAVFRCFKNDLGLRPIFHQIDTRVEAHIFVCFQAYCLWVTLHQRLRPLAPGLTPRQAIAQLAGIQMLDVEIPTTDERVLRLTRYTQPDRAVALLLQRLGKTLPDQPPPKLISPEKLDLPGGSL